VDLASMPGTTAVAKTVSLKLTPTDSKPPVSLTLGSPKGGFDGRNAVSPGHDSRGGIDLADGHLSFTHTDFSLPFKAGALGFTRSFNNQDNALRPLGLGWTDNYDGWVIEERVGRYAVVLGGQAYSFPKCESVPTDEAHRGNASECKTDKSHGMTLEVTAPLKVSEGSAPDDHVTVTTSDGWEYDFDKPVGLRMEGRRKWLLTRFADAHRAGNDGAWMDLSYEEGDRLERVKRHDGSAQLDFTYTDVDQTDSDMAEGVKLLARHGFAFLSQVDVSVGTQVRYSVAIEHDEHGNLTRAATDSGQAPYQIWGYDYETPSASLSDEQKWAATNELSDVRLIHGATPQAQAPIQWKAHYERGVDAAPYTQELPLEVVTSVSATGMQGGSLEISFDGEMGRTAQRPDGVTEAVSLNEYGNTKSLGLPSGASGASSWGSDTRGGAVFPQSNSTPAGYGTTSTPTDRLVTQQVWLGSAPPGAQGVAGASAGSLLFDQHIDASLGLPLGGTVASADGQLPFASPRTPGGDLLGLNIGQGTEGRSPLSNAYYDSDGVLLGAVDGQGRSWTFSSFNGLGEAQQAQATLAGATGLGVLTRTMTYDPQGRLTSASEAETGAFESWHYDGLGRLTEHLIAGSPNEDWTYHYQAANLQLTVTETLAKPDGVEDVATHPRPTWTKATTYTEDAVSESYLAGNPAVPVTRTTHLIHGRPESMTDELGHEWHYGYDENGHLDSVTTADGLVAKARTLDADGRVLSETNALGAVTLTSYDALGRAAGQDFGNGDVVNTTADPRGGVTHRSFGTGTHAHAVTFTPDALGLTASASSAGGVNTTTVSDSAGRTVSFEDATRGLSETYAYADVLGRLTGFTRSMNGGALHLTETRSYDDATHTVAVERSIDTGLQDASVRTESETLTTDARGRMLTQTKDVDGTQATTTFEYNERGQVWRTTSPLNEVTRRFYDVSGALAEAVDAEGYKTEYLRDGLEQLSAETGPHPGRTVTYGYDSIGRTLSKTVAGYGTTPEMSWTYAYPGLGQVVETALLDSGGNVTTRTLNGRGRLVSEVIASRDEQDKKRSRTIAFDGPWQGSELTNEGDWQLSVTTDHDDLGRPKRSDESWHGLRDGYEYSYDYTSATAWNGLDADVSWTDETGGKYQSYTASLETDSLGHVVSRTQDGLTDGWLYDAAGKLSKQTPAGRPPTVASYVNGLLKTSTYGLGSTLEVTTYGYDADGRTTSVLTPDARTHVLGYWPRGLVKQETYGTTLGSTTTFLESTTTAYMYDAQGQLASKTEGAGTPDAKTWTYAYGPRGEIQGASQPDGIGDFGYEYDGLLRLTKVKPPSGSPSPETKYGYDYFGREASKQRGASVWLTTWAGGAGTTTSPLNDVFTRLYDGRGRLAEEAYQPGAASTAQTELTHVVRRYTGTDSPWETVETHRAGEVNNEYTYDGNRRLTQLTRGSETVGYTYRDSGERLSVTSPLGVVSYGYDALERLLSVTGPAGTTQVEWEAGGARLLALTDATLTERHCYDGRGWMTVVVNATSDVSCNALGNVTGLHTRFEYGYDGRGNRMRQTYLDGSLSTPEVTEYGYNGADWLTGVKYPDGHAALYGLGPDGTRKAEREVSAYAGSLGPDGYGFAADANPTKDWTYGFDAQGGLKEATRPEVQPGGGVTQVQVASWTTDAAGRVTRSVTPEGTRDFAWSARDTLGQATFTPAVSQGDPTPVTVSYGYDEDGLRRSRTVNGDSAGYLWAAGQLLEERLPGNDVLYASAAGMAVSAGADRLAHDGLGSVVGLVGASTTTRKYDAWGGFLDGTSPNSGQPSVAYAGQAYDVDLGTSYARARWKDSVAGRWLSLDPIGVTADRLMLPAGLNPWSYGNQNPTRFTDPNGRCSRNALGSLSDLGYCLTEDIGHPLANAGIWVANESHYIKEDTRQELGLAPLADIKDAYSYYKPQQRRRELPEYDAFEAEWNQGLRGPTPQRTVDGRLVLLPQTNEQRVARAHNRQVEGAIQGVDATAHLALKATSVALEIDMAFSGVGALRALGTDGFAARTLDTTLDKSIAEESLSQDVASGGRWTIASGNPREIVLAGGRLNARQQRLLSALGSSGTKTIVRKSEVGLKDLAALTAETGDEFAMFTTGGRRLVVRGDVQSVPIAVEDATQLASERWRWSAHTHPGLGKGVLRSSIGDRAVLGQFGADAQSAILNSTGDRSLFDPNGDLLTGWLP